MVRWIDHFTVVGLVSEPLSEREAEVDLVLIQTSFVSYRNYTNTNKNYFNIIYLLNQEGMYQLQPPFDL